MKIKPILYLSIFLITLMGCSTPSIKLPLSDEIAYVIVYESLGEENEKEGMYEIDEEGNFKFIKDEDNLPQKIEIYKYQELFRITDPSTINSLLDKLKYNTQGEANFTFSGTLPSALFVNKAGKPMFSVAIFCDDSSILIDEKTISFDNLKKIMTCSAVNQIITEGINRPYVKTFFQLLKQKAPEEISKREKYYEKQGGLEKRLKIKTP